jgi:hypothetical protein
VAFGVIVVAANALEPGALLGLFRDLIELRLVDPGGVSGRRQRDRRNLETVSVLVQLRRAVCGSSAGDSGFAERRRSAPSKTSGQHGADHLFWIAPFSPANRVPNVNGLPRHLEASSTMTVFQAAFPTC